VPGAIPLMGSPMVRISSGPFWIRSVREKATGDRSVRAPVKEGPPVGGPGFTGFPRGWSRFGQEREVGD
jgi:hypothetical protein